MKPRRHPPRGVSAFLEPPMTKPKNDEGEAGCPTKLEQARKLFGSRLTERGALGYSLDGHSVTVQAVLRAAGL